MNNAEQSVHPRTSTVRDGGYMKTITEPGLTKRELFAAMAMQGMLSNPAICDMTSGDASRVALWANQCADALLAELAKDGEP